MPVPSSTPNPRKPTLPHPGSVISTGAAKPRSGETRFSTSQSSTRKELPADTERRRQLRGLMLLAFAVMAFALWRAGIAPVFTSGWWRLW